MTESSSRRRRRRHYVEQEWSPFIIAHVNCVSLTIHDFYPCREAQPVSSQPYDYIDLPAMFSADI